MSGRSLDDKIRAGIDNMVSRCIGFIIRLGVLIAAAIAAFGSFAAAAIMVIAWPLLPIAIPYFVIRGITG